LALDNTLGGVESEHPGSHFTHWRHRLDDGAVQFEVLVPYVTPRIEKSNWLASAIYGCDIRAFVPVAKDTGIGKIADTRRASVLPANDVIDLVRKTSAVLMYQAVFTASSCAFDDEAPRGLVYIKSHWRESVGPAPSRPGGCAPSP